VEKKKKNREGRKLKKHLLRRMWLITWFSSSREEAVGSAVGVEGMGS
jgi:hypothetical protein